PRVPPPLPMCDQHAVAEAVEAIAPADRLGVSIEDALATGKGAHQHEQRALRQVEVRQHGVDDPEPMAGEDEQAGPPLRAFDGTPAPDRLEASHAGGADRN